MSSLNTLYYFIDAAYIKGNLKGCSVADIHTLELIYIDLINTKQSSYIQSNIYKLLLKMNFKTYAYGVGYKVEI